MLTHRERRCDRDALTKDEGSKQKAGNPNLVPSFSHGPPLQSPRVSLSQPGHPRLACGGWRSSRLLAPGFPESGREGRGDGSSWRRTTEGSCALLFHFGAAAAEGNQGKGWRLALQPKTGNKLRVTSKKAPLNTVKSRKRVCGECW